MSVNGREIDQLVKETQNRLELYKSANIGELLTTSLASFEESTKSIEESFSRLDRIKARLETKHQLQSQQIVDLGNIEREFKLQREQRYSSDSQKLQVLIDSPARIELLHTREEISRLTKSLIDIQKLELDKLLTHDQKLDVLKLQIYQSLGLRLEKLEDLEPNEVWDLIKEIWSIN